ncbi:hypothetical protein PHYBOEH_010939 [Phytophthora boehmeriae]|uniref:Auto-transporter adhesin head GIN domain-containing protein n=1 Tax=Phytophthora boehmeriae TaxID=109152 RepID=A0A8T1WWH7_9STRA|nr:hypothetical protein PHYBOEH_010939 [Phytophthora boehmeriae]
MIVFSKSPLVLVLLVATLLVALFSSSAADSDFSVSSAATESVDSSTDHVSFVKQWTLSSSNTPNSNNNNDDDDDSDDDSSDDGDKIDSLKLQLRGRVFVSYVSGLPSGILGYVNVSGDSQSVVEMVKVSSNDDDEELEVKFDGSTSNANSGASGYLLTEIFLATSSIVKEVEIESTAEVVIEDSVLVSSNANREVQVKASDSSAVYVSSSAMSLQDLKLELSDSATLQLTTDSIELREDGEFQAKDSSSLSIIAPSVTANKLDLDAENSGTICLSASTVTASNFDGQGASRISLPNASSKYTSTGSQECTEATAPSRGPSCVFSSSCTTTSTSTTTTSTTTPSATTATSTSTTSTPDSATASSVAASSSSGVSTQSSTASSPDTSRITSAVIAAGLMAVAWL